MATIITHPIIAVGLSPWLRYPRRGYTIIVCAMLLTILPDIDVLGFNFGIPYAHLFGHRGFTHSLLFAAVVSGLVSWLLVQGTSIRLAAVWSYLFICTMSHGLLDAMTNGGLGIAFFSPFSNERFFFPWRPIEVSTLSVKRFFAGQGYGVLSNEITWVWLPLTAIFITGLLWRWSMRRLTRLQQENS